MQVDARVDVVAALSRVQQEPREFQAEIHVVRTATPAPVSQYRSTTLALRVTSTRLQLAQTTSFGYGVGHSGRGYGIRKSRFFVTFFKENAAVGIAVFALESRAVPAMFLELILALFDGQLEALDGGGHHIRIAEAQLQLLLTEAGEILADDAGLRPPTLLIHHRVEEVLVLFESIFHRFEPRH